MDRIDELLTRGVANVIPNKTELKALLESGKKLNIYLGIDPTATKIHIGHAVPLRKLQAFTQLGHKVTFLIGDFTALIGDTSDKDTERPILTDQQIRENFKTYKKQAEKIVDFSKVKVVHNSDWLKKLSFTDIVKLCQHFSFGDFASRELIAKRLKDKKHVGLHEALYPVMQGYDSYHLDTDIQIGGTDQTFNMQAGRTLQKALRGKESFVLTMEFLIGTDGKKMSKTGGNAVWIEETPETMYAKLMAVGDELIATYFLLATNVSMEKVKEVEKRLKEGENPRDIKMELARVLVTELHGAKEADLAAEHFAKTVQRKELPDEIEEISVSQAFKEGRLIVDILLATNLSESRSDAKRLVQQGGVEVEGKRIDNPNEIINFTNGMIIKVGKRKFAKIKE